MEIEDEEGDFPVDIAIEDVREAIAGRDDFREVTAADHSIFVYYLGMAKDIFPNPLMAPDQRTAYLWKLRRECRGLVFDKNNKVIARRFHKFFNVNETEETFSCKINLQKHFVITEKLDGTMISPYFTLGKLRYATKTGVTDSTINVEAFVKISDIPYTHFSSKWIAKGFSPIFEYCGPKQPVVLTYAEESLKLISMRHMITGKYINYSKLVIIAEEEKIPLIKCWTPSELGLSDLSMTNFQTFEQEIKNQKNIEGFVLRFNDGNMIKIKTNWYFTLNKSLDKIKNCSERHLWNSILSEEYDDIKGFLNQAMRASMDEFAYTLNERIHGATVRLLAKTRSNIHLKRKEFSTWTEQQPSEERRILWLLRDILLVSTDNENNIISQAREKIVKYILGSLGKAKTWKQNAIPLLGNIRFKSDPTFQNSTKKED